MRFIHNAGQLPEGSRICIYGKGARGAELHAALRVASRPQVRCFVDSFASGEFQGLPVLRLDEFARTYDPGKDHVVVASAFYPQIVIALAQAGIREWSIYEDLPLPGEARNGGSHILHGRSTLLGYRDRESLAKRALPNWRIGQRHNLDHFERFGFPVRITHFLETRQLLDTMQESRFGKLQEELGGLTDADALLLADACADLAAFQLQHYPGNRVIVPLDTLLAMLVVYRKLSAVAPGFRSILEVGPGCGYLAFFLKRHPGLENYSLTESCESFYILQDAINRRLFQGRFRQMLSEDSGGEWYIRRDDPLHAALSLTDVEAQATVRHYPWWKLGDIADSKTAFDVVNSNANLLEFNTDALRDYLNLFREKLKPQGVFFAHCFGCESPEKNRAYLYEELYRAGFAPLLICHGAHIKAREYWTGRLAGQCDPIAPDDARKFVVGNGVFVRQGHPLHEAHYARENYQDMYAADFPGLAAFFAPPPPGCRLRSREEIIALMRERLDSFTQQAAREYGQ
ncbi:hypothetical protein NNJEOMEG_02791 [Fundidesulfovibrio magnetotacticus]|uniref:Uncharacterized protein n=1 Tax=Fundidesulfovibrio magnetotacticus TaxID=2730080 RepID=A0A6V8LR31_9BACT|nr:hypothetical protein [Fundidesulfovibrio magnetotacticus]GFK94943.1 hypothetical protein NNJEOMEG_02791 [Fundidesulfovibrio magnetotacticus]